MTMSNKIVAIMPIKMNNERLQGKNTMPLGGKPLLTYELEALKSVTMIDRIIVYCSSEEIKNYLPEGIDFLKRPEYLDLPTSNFSQIFECFMSEINADIYVYAHATAPFVKSKTIMKCIEAVTSGDYDSAFCAERIQDYLWQDGKPLNFDATDIPRSQDIKPIYRETSGVYVFTKNVFEELHRRVGVNPYICEVGYKESVDINYPADFLLAENLLNIDL